MATVQNDGLLRVWQRPVDDPVIAQAAGWIPTEFRLPSRIPRVEGVVIARETGWGHRPRISFDGKLVAQGFWHESPLGSRHQGVNRLRVIATANGQPAGANIFLPGALVDS